FAGSVQVSSRNSVHAMLGGSMSLRVLLTNVIVGGLTVAAAENGAEKQPKPSPGVTMIVTDRFQVPSQMPWTYAEYLDPESPKCILKKEDVLPSGFMYWSFYGGTLDPTAIVADNLVFFFAMEARHIRPMMEGLDNLDPELVRKLEKSPLAV